MNHTNSSCLVAARRNAKMPKCKFDRLKCRLLTFLSDGEKKPSYNNDYAELIFITSLTVSINQFAIEWKWIRNCPRMIDIQWVAKNSHICFHQTESGTYNLLRTKALHLGISLKQIILLKKACKRKCFCFFYIFFFAVNLHQ